MELRKMFAGVSETAMMLTLAMVDADVESKAIKAQITSLREDLKICGEVVWQGVLAQRVEEKLPYETIKALAREANPIAHVIPSTIKVYCSSMASAETLGLTLSMATSHGDCRKRVAEKKAKEAQAADKESADSQSNKMGEKLKGELTDAQVCKQATALFKVMPDLRVLFGADLEKIYTLYVAYKAKIAAAKIAETQATVDQATIREAQAAKRKAKNDQIVRNAIKAKAALDAEYAAANLTKAA